MLVYEYKIKANTTKLAAIDGAIRTGQYIRNKCLRFWMDADPEQKINRFALNKYSTIVANDPEMPFAKLIHSNARQGSA